MERSSAYTDQNGYSYATVWMGYNCKPRIKATAEKAKAIDKTKLAMLRNVQTMDFSRSNHEKHIKSDKPTIDMDSG